VVNIEVKVPRKLGGHSSHSLPQGFGWNLQFSGDFGDVAWSFNFQGFNSLQVTEINSFRHILFPLAPYVTVLFQGYQTKPFR
jgi:hypothetical protein